MFANCSRFVICFSLGFYVQTRAGEPVDFQRDILPIIQSRCIDCHGPDAQEGQLRLDARATTFRGGVSGTAVVRGQAKDSLLYKRLVTSDAEERMPQDDDPLKASELALIQRWIDEGARWPDGVGADVRFEKHWAYVAPERPALPDVTNRAWAQTAIDYFILARLEKEGLSPSRRADRARLIRRVYLDLIGIPPTPEEVAAFVDDAGPQAYERVVDRLLASPQYGVRWARGWLDLARYADSNGYQADQYRNVWPYRDWVIRALNNDMPFDQFTIEQLAGDLLPSATIDQRIATGFSRLTTCNVEAGVDPEENRVNQVMDRVNTFGTVWLGTTVECMQCHNHKYDPFSQKEYYELFAYFNNTPLEVKGDGVSFDFVGPKMDLPLNDAQQARRNKLQRQIDSAKIELEQLVAARKKQQSAWEKQVAATQRDAPKWHVLQIDSFLSQGGASFERLDDASVLVTGKEPDKDFYTVTATTDLTEITGFKIESLTHDSLPQKGPGRHERPNFVLYEFTVTAYGGEMKKPTPLPLHSAAADFSQARFDVAGAIDGKPDTAWAINPQFGRPHWATFLTRKPVGNGQRTKLTFGFDQHYGGCRTIGRLRISAMTGAPGKAAMPPAVAKIIDIEPAKRTDQQKKQLTDHFVNQDPQVSQARDRITTLQKQADAIKPVTSLVMIEHNKPRATHVLRRGNFLNKAEAVSAGTPSELHMLPPDLPANRLGLARWVVDPGNPLTGRVAVNRWWAEFFGHGIVATLEDLGTQAEPPTHPQLLDWLAREFVDQGWSMKHVHKLIVTSATYQQTSRVNRQLVERDPNNLLYARGPRFRLTAEMIRDNALAIAGLLSTKMHGPPIYPPQPDGLWRHVGRNAPKYNTSTGNDRFRRGVYVVWRRSAPYASFTNFDAPDRASCVVARPRTNTPLQALTLLNDPAYIEMAKALAERIATLQSEMTVEQKIAYAMKLCVAREPKSSEIELLHEVFERERVRFEENLRAARTLVGDAADKQVPKAELAAWFYIANILLNLDETITKG